MRMYDFKNRIIGAAKLDISIYEEVELDEKAMGQAVGVVALSSVAAGIGSIIEGGIIGIFWGTVSAFLSWFIWAYLTYFIGTRFLPEPQTRSNPGELLRTIGFSSSPGLIRVLGIIPGLSAVIFFLASIWMLVAMVVAVRQALDYRSTWRAVGVCLIGWIIQVLILTLLLSILGGGQALAA